MQLISTTYEVRAITDEDRARHELAIPQSSSRLVRLIPARTDPLAVHVEYRLGSLGTDPARGDRAG
jgi:hypothetical protein